MTGDSRPLAGDGIARGILLGTALGTTPLGTVAGDGDLGTVDGILHGTLLGIALGTPVGMAAGMLVGTALTTTMVGVAITIARRTLHSADSREHVAAIQAIPVVALVVQAMV